MSADFIISAMKEAKDKINAQHARIDELLQKTQQLERENAALREAFAKAEVLWRHAGRHGEKEFAYVSGYFHPGEIIVFVDRAAIDAARKEAKP